MRLAAAPAGDDARNGDLELDLLEVDLEVEVDSRGVGVEAREVLCRARAGDGDGDGDGEVDVLGRPLSSPFLLLSPNFLVFFPISTDLLPSLAP